MTSEKKRDNSSLDPGSLMVVMYILGVSALVLLGWFGPAGAGGGAGEIQQAMSHAAHY